MEATLEDVGQMNTASLLSAFERRNNCDVFLQDDTAIPFHSTNVDMPLLYDTDIDGLVIQLTELKGLKANLHYIYLPRFENHHLRTHWTILKKHVQLHNCSASGLDALRCSQGVTLAHVDGGYFLNLTVLPTDMKQPHQHTTTTGTAKNNAVELFGNVAQIFKGKLKNLPPKDRARATVQKNNPNQLAKMNVLKKDRLFILQLLDESIAQATASNDHMFIMKTLSKFGEKDEDPLALNTLVDLTYVQNMSVHAACTLAAQNPSTHLLWSRYGLQNLVGPRGRLYTALSIHEAVNFQSNLDGRAMDISSELRHILRPPKVNFLQLYVNSPHLHIQSPFRHPVSGVIVTCGLSHPQFTKAMLMRAISYLDHMEDLASKMVSQLECRVEQVVFFDSSTGIPSTFDAADAFNIVKLKKLLAARPVFVPFVDDAHGKGLLTTCRKVLDHLIGTLRAFFNSHLGIGGFEASWRSFQSELALEEFFYGHPLSPTDLKYSVSLGTNSTNSFSLTFERGFLGLSPFSSAVSEVEPPPLHHWTRDSLQILRIKRVFPLTDTLEAAPVITGEELLKVLLCDIYKRNEGIPLAGLCGSSPPGILKGALTLDSFVQELATRDSFPVPATFGRARTLVVRTGKDVAECLLLGFQELHIHYFPAVSFRDYKAVKRVYWKPGEYFEVLYGNQNPSPLARAVAVSGDVCLEIERRSLSYSRNLEKYRDLGMPWMEAILRRLPRSMDKAGHLKMVTFISCVGMLMNGDFVTYEHLKTLIADMPFSQANLQKLQIQSRFLLNKHYGINIWRLHERIPYRLTKQLPAAPAKSKQSLYLEDGEQPFEDVQALDETEDLPPAPRSASRYLPACTSLKWSSQELSLVDLHPSKTHKDAYENYLKSCTVFIIAARTFGAFKQKRNKMMDNKN